MKTMKLAMAAVALAAFSGPASAVVAFDNFNTGDTFDTGTGWTISGSGSIIGAMNSQGEQFTSAATGTVSSVTIAMGYVTGATNGATINLYTDNGSGNIGSLIGTWSISGMGSFGSAYVPSTAVGSGGGASLTSGSKYWLIAEAAPTDWLAWNWNNVGGTGDHWFNGSNTGAATQGAFRMEVVPEPGTMIALGAGLAALARRRRK